MTVTLVTGGECAANLDAQTRSEPSTAKEKIKILYYRTRYSTAEEIRIPVPVP